MFSCYLVFSEFDKVKLKRFPGYVWSNNYNPAPFAAQKMKFSIKDFFSKCDQIRSFLKKSLIENPIICAVLQIRFSWTDSVFLLSKIC